MRIRRSGAGAACKQGTFNMTTLLLERTAREPGNNIKKPKGWQHTDPLEEEDINVEPTENQTEPDSQMGQKQSQEDNAPTTHLGRHISDLHQELQMEVSGIKRTHGSEGSS